MKNISFAFFNVTSLTRHLSAVKDLLSVCNFDLLGVSETRLANGALDEYYKIDKYILLHKERSSGTGGGVGIYVKENLNCELLVANCSEILEEVWVKVELDRKQFFFGSLYRTPGFSNFDAFVDCLEERFSVFSVGDIICGGDLNINLLDSNCYCERYLDCMDSFNLKQVISSPTRVTNTSATLIDHILFPANVDNVKCDIKDLGEGVSDHAVVCCELTGDASVSKTKVIFRNLENIDKDLLENLLALTPFENIVNLTDINQKVYLFNTMLLNLFDVLAPKRDKIIGKRRQPWFTDTIKQMVKLKNKAYNAFKNDRSDSKWNYYKELRNFTNREKTIF